MKSRVPDSWPVCTTQFHPSTVSELRRGCWASWLVEGCHGVSSKRSAQAGGWKPTGPRLDNGEAWFTTAVLAEARSTLAP